MRIDCSPFKPRIYATEWGVPVIRRVVTYPYRSRFKAPRPGAMLSWSQWQWALSMIGAYVRGDQGKMTPTQPRHYIPDTGDRRLKLHARRVKAG